MELSDLFGKGNNHEESEEEEWLEISSHAWKYLYYDRVRLKLMDILPL